LLLLHWEKSWENVEKKTDNFCQFCQDENIFVKMVELFAHFDKNILILTTLEKVFCLFS